MKATQFEPLAEAQRIIGRLLDEPVDREPLLDALAEVNQKIREAEKNQHPWHDLDEDLLKNRYYTREQLAKILGYTQRHLMRMDAEQRGPPVTRIGHRVIYRKEGVQEWLLAHERVQGQSPLGVRGRR